MSKILQAILATIPQRPLRMREVAEICSVNEITARNWHRRGIEIDGRNIRLDAARIGAMLVVHPDDLISFLTRCNHGEDTSPTRTQAAIDQAKKALKRKE